MKHKIKQVCAGLLSLTLLTMAVIPHIGKQKAEAFSSVYGVCIDNHNFSTQGAWSKNDKYTNKMTNMNQVQAQYGYGSPEYKAALKQNVDTLRRAIGDDEKIVRMFWAGVVAFVTEGKTFANESDLRGAQYWINYAQVNYTDSIAHGYAPALATNFVPMSESELGIVLHGAAGQQLIDRDPFLKILSNPHTLFEETYDPNRNYTTDPLALPRLGNSWLNSYGATQEGQNGRGQWPEGFAGHEVSVVPGTPISYETVAAAAFDVDSMEKYKVEGEEFSYSIPVTEDFYNNSGYLKVWNNSAGGMWSSYTPMTMINQTVNVDGWDITFSANPGAWSFDFKFTGGNKPTGLVMYFELPQNSVTSANTLGFDSPVEFVARFTNLYTCDACGGTHNSGRLDPSKHQRHISFYFDGEPSECYPCFRLGDPITVPESPETNLDFNIYRHKEDWTTNYNVQLEKKDYETGEPLENSIFELYERFDDKDEVNLERDGAVELYKGGDDTCKQSIVI